MTINRENSRQSAALVLAAAIGALMLAAPAAAQRDAPAAGTFLGADLISEDAEAASGFYADLFGWDVEMVEDGGYRINHKGRLIGSISQIGASADVDRSFWLVALAVNDLKQSIRAARENNATVYEKITRVKDLGRFAVIGDAEKAPVMFIQSGKVPIGGTTGPGAWIWAELWTDDIGKAATFYADVIGVGHGTTDRGGAEYHYFVSQGRPRAGIIKIPVELEDVDPGWAPYVGVSDISVTLAKVKELGGRIIFGEIEHPSSGAVALIMDPTGAVLFVYQLGSAQEAK
jgi:predicted enzyme related to lactoylglutathione lyase